MARSYPYFPGCSVHSTALEYGESAIAVCRALGVSLEELPDWVCCGATPTASYSYDISLGLGVKNLEMVKGGSLVTPCSACFKNLKGAEEHLAEQNAKPPKVQHLFQLVYDDVGLAAVKENVKAPLKGLKVASYYGCLLTRVDPTFDSAEDPKKLDELTRALGGEPVRFAAKMKCCGGPITLSKHSRAVEMGGMILKAAKATDAHAVVTLCPMCGMMLDLYQKEALAGRKQGQIPVVYFTQLMALAFGLGAEAALDMNVVSTRPIMAALAGGRK